MHDQNEFINKRYKLVKIQHHATNAYFTDKTPKGKNGVVSNGGYSYRKVGRDFVDNKLYDNIICTDAHTRSSDFCERPS